MQFIFFTKIIWRVVPLWNGASNKNNSIVYENKILHFGNGHGYLFKMQKLFVILIVYIFPALTAAQITPYTDACFSSAAKYQQVDETVLRAIAMKESSNCNPIIRSNKNKSIDVGCMQINSIHFHDLKKYGVTPKDLLDQCTNIYIGAWHYKKKIIKHGNNWIAVGAYHSETQALRDPYARDVHQIWSRLRASIK